MNDPAAAPGPSHLLPGQEPAGAGRAEDNTGGEAAGCRGGERGEDDEDDERDGEGWRGEQRACDETAGGAGDTDSSAGGQAPGGGEGGQDGGRPSCCPSCFISI